MLTLIKTLWKQTITHTLEAAKTVSKALLESKPVLALKFSVKWLGEVYVRLEFNG